MSPSASQWIRKLNAILASYFINDTIEANNNFFFILIMISFEDVIMSNEVYWTVGFANDGKTIACCCLMIWFCLGFIHILSIIFLSYRHNNTLKFLNIFDTNATFFYYCIKEISCQMQEFYESIKPNKKLLYLFQWILLMKSMTYVNLRLNRNLRIFKRNLSRINGSYDTYDT